MKEAKSQPSTYRGTKITWIKNEPKYKTGDVVVYYSHRDGKYISITLSGKPVKKLADIKDYHRCYSCKRIISLNKYFYSWGAFTEGSEITDVADYLNRKVDAEKELMRAGTDLEKKAKLYDQIKNALNGDLDEDY